MKNKFILAVAVLVSASLITSCSIEKRHYMSGYHVEWKNNNEKSNTVTAQQDKTQTVAKNETVAFTDEQITAPVIENTTQNAVVTDVTSENTDVVVNSQTSKINTVVADHDAAKQEVTVKNNTKESVKVAAKQTQNSPADDVPKGLLIVLCFLLPWLAVGLATNWEVKPLIINLLWCLTCIGGIIHALIVVNREVK